MIFKAVLLTSLFRIYYLGMQANKIFSCVLVFAISSVISFWVEYKNYEGGISQEFCHYSEIGRNINEGKGFRTNVLFPSSLAILESAGKAGFPEKSAPVIDRFPLHAYLTALFQKFLGINDEAQLMLSLFYLALLSAATAAAAAALWGAEAGFSAGLLIALAPAFQRGFLLWGLPDFGFALLTLAAVFAFSGMLNAPGRSLEKWFFAGIPAGLTWLCRSNFILWTPLFILGIIALLKEPFTRRLRFALFYLAGLVLAAFPGLYHNLKTAGDINPPTFAWNLSHLAVTLNLPWLEYKTFPVLEALKFPAALAKKWLFLFSSTAKAWPFMWQFYLIWPAAALGLAKAWKNRERDKGIFNLFFAFSAMLFLQIAVFCFLRFETLGSNSAGRYYVWFAPAAVLMAIYWTSCLKPVFGRIFLAANIAVFAWWLVKPQGTPVHPLGLAPEKWPEIKAAAACSPQNGLVVSNISAQIAWYTGKRSVHLPVKPEDLLKISRKYKLSSVLITSLPVGELRNTPKWKAIIGDKERLDSFSRKLDMEFRDMGTSVVLCRQSRGN